MRELVYCVLFVALSASTVAQTVAPRPPAPASGRLPVKKVVLYKNGVGYFEHTGRVTGSQQVDVDFTTAQLDDVIKSLTVLDLDRGRITGIRYNSVAPLEERLRTLRLSLGERASRFDFLQSLRGARLEVRSGSQVVVGRLLAVESRPRLKEQQRLDITEVSLITDTGELRSLELTPATAVRIVDGELREEVSRYLGLVGSTRERDVRRMTISAEGAGDRRLFVSYISEVPVWKSTYRIVLPDQPNGQALLQGWAIVDNTVGEDWKNVELSLVAGAPQSFVQRISQPLYAHRPVIDLPQAAQLAPQSHESTLNDPAPTAAAILSAPAEDALLGHKKEAYGASAFSLGPGAAGTNLQGTVRDRSGAVVPHALVTLSGPGENRSTATDSSGNYIFHGLHGGAYSLTFNSPGFKRTVARVNVSPGTSRRFDAALNVSSADETVEVTASAQSISEQLEDEESDAEAQDLGDLFEYKLKQRVTIGKNQSALVPIVQTHIAADRVSLWNGSRGRALRAIWLHNTSGLSLDAGTFNVLDQDTFAGEGLLQVIRPGEKRLLSYAVDQSVKVDVESENRHQKVTRVRILHGVMTTTFGTRDAFAYTIRNNDNTPRTVVLEHPARDGWKLVSSAQPEETTESFHRFRISVEPHQTAAFAVEEFQPQESTFHLTGLTDDNITLFLQQKSINGTVAAELRKVIAQKGKVAAVEARIRQRQKEINDVAADQQRVRENMKALKGSPEEKALLQRYATQLNGQEDRLDAARKELAALETERAAATSELQRIIAAISLDEMLAAD